MPCVSFQVFTIQPVQVQIDQIDFFLGKSYHLPLFPIFWSKLELRLTNACGLILNWPQYWPHYQMNPWLLKIMDSHGIRYRRSRRHCPITFGAWFSINSPLPLAFSETYRPFNERDSVSECAGAFEWVRNSCRAVTPACTGLAADQCSPFPRGLPVAASQKGGPDAAETVSATVRLARGVVPMAAGGNRQTPRKVQSHRKFTGFQRNRISTDPLHECQCHLLPSTAGPDLSGQSRPCNCKRQVFGWGFFLI